MVVFEKIAFVCCSGEANYSKYAVHITAKHFSALSAFWWHVPTEDVLGIDRVHKIKETRLLQSR